MEFHITAHGRTGVLDSAQPTTKHKRVLGFFENEIKRISKKNALIKGVETDLKNDTIKLMHSSIYSLKRPLFWFAFILSKHFYIKQPKERAYA